MCGVMESLLLTLIFFTLVAGMLSLATKALSASARYVAVAVLKGLG